MVQQELPNTGALARQVVPADSPLGRAFGRAAQAVALALSELAGVEMRAADPRIEVLPLCELASIGGCPGDNVVALFLTYGGSDSGQIMLLYDLDQARMVADQMLWNPPGTTVELDEMVISALSESGNILASHFLTAIAETAGMQLEISTPRPLVDFRGAALSIPAVAVAHRGDTFLSIRIDFHSDSLPLVGTTLLVVPDDGFDSTVIRSLS
ncbi:MAG TPA: chemotaxis protein CheC [Thermomicrobiales bacterium]|nr:chemotaxis protein CheC [Thermomicrobiales bacterium]